MFNRVHTCLLALVVMLPLWEGVAQSDSIFCGTTIVSSQQQIGGEVVTSFGTLKVLMVMIDFPDDTIDVNNPTWPVGTGPNFLNAIIDSTEEQNSGIYANLSTFFKNMSYGQFRMIGKAYYVQAPHTLAYYRAKYPGSESAYSARDAILLLDQTVDFTDYDRWIDSSYNHILGQDGIVDMVFIGYRRWYICEGDLGGCSFVAEGWYEGSLPGGIVYVDNGARRITSSHSVSNTRLIQYPRFEHIVHEFGHAWGLNHQYAPGFWSLMGHRFGTNTPFMNSVERVQLGWIAFHDIQGSQTASLRDFGTYGDAYRIPIGNGEYFILENHQLGSPYDLPALDATRGLYVLRQFPYQFTPYEGNLSVETARGRFNWTNPSWTHYPTNGAWIPVFKQEQSNRTGGANERTPLYAVDPNTGRGDYHLVQAKINPATGQTVFIGFCICGFYRGSAGDQFDATNCAVFSPWSNPSACTRSGSLTNISFEVLPSSSSTIDVQFFIGNPLNASPSKPQDLRVGLSGSHPFLTWAQMQEPDVQSGGFIHIERRLKPIGSTWSAWSEIGTIAGNETSFVDYGIHQGCQGTCPDSVQYRIRARDNTGKYSVYSDIASKTYYYFKEGVDQTIAGRPLAYKVHEVHPNPFNPTTTIRYDLPGDSHVSLVIYDVLGRKVAEVINEVQGAGFKSVTWDASAVASGVYLARFTAIDENGSVKLSKTIKLVLAK
jgi:M6 family metalloprotease-like protein